MEEGQKLVRYKAYNVLQKELLLLIKSKKNDEFLLLFF